MAVDTTKLFRYAAYDKNSMFVYDSPDVIATVIAADYFGTIAEKHQLRVGDIIFVKDESTPTLDCVMVTAVDYAAQTNTVLRLFFGT